ncbi:MAG: aspartyl/glutamyl-tRNA(Asn/Gln) amidotransferase subunit C [Rickettsiaceae bacterium 4572_127]|nr:MAG: aspartyl/glutamyl-tRNA(Asn/Gln) amidotransferase subunit C [Rickettsiaceae bacterium 4572_127]
MDIKVLKKLAHLSRIEMTDEELKKTAPNISSILTLVNKLNELNTDNVEPLFSTAQNDLPRRQDIVTETSKRDEILQNAPSIDKDKKFFTVPTVVE